MAYYQHHPIFKYLKHKWKKRTFGVHVIATKTEIFCPNYKRESIVVVCIGFLKKF